MIFCPHKYAWEIEIVLLPFYEIVETITWDDYNFNIVLQTMSTCTMK
jgi:hypothetical protein